MRTWDFEQKIFLHGPWLFFPDRLLHRLPLRTPDTIIETFTIPGTWNQRSRANGKKFGGSGFATFGLKLRLPDHAPPPAIRVNFMLTAYELTANGKLVCRNGKPGRTRAESVPHYVPCTATLPRPGKDGIVTILLRVSNFHHRRGGPRGHMSLDSRTRTYARELRSIIIDVFLNATMILVGLYYLLLFGQRRRQKEFLLFALFCFALAGRSISLEEMVLIRLIPTLPWELFWRFLMACTYFIPPLIYGFFQASFPEDFSSRWFRVYSALGGLFLASLLLPVRHASWGVLLISPMILVACLHICFLLTRSIRRKRSLAGVQLAGLILMLAFMINDMLHDLQIVRTGYHASLGLFIFISFQAFVMTLRYARAYATIEKMYQNLMDHQQAELELLESNRAKDRFLSIISHDLRGPFSGMYESLRLLSKQGANLSHEELLRTIRKIEQAGTGIHGLMENLLEWARSRMGRMPYEPTKLELRAFLSENLELFRANLDAKEIQAEILVPEGVVIEGDERMLGTIARNLISNAVKFTPRGGRITLDMGKVRADGKTEVVFTDTGIGMDSRTRPGTEGEPGGGLGLLLSRDLLEMNHGELIVENVPTRGTRIRVVLPA